MSYGGGKNHGEWELTKYSYFRYRWLRKYLAILHPVETWINESFNTTQEKLKQFGNFADSDKTIKKYAKDYSTNF